MKHLPRLFAACMTLTASAWADTTTPAGYVTVTFPAGSPSSPSNTPMSIPLQSAPVFASSIASTVSATELTLSGAAWTTGQFASTANPHLAKIVSGANVGRFFLITANSSNQLTLSLAQSPTITDLRTALSVGDKVAIIRANTLGSVFGTTSPVLVTGSSAAAADNVYLLNGPGLGWSTYYHNGTSWRKAGSLASQNNTILYPDEGILVVHIGASPVTLNFTGLVPTGDERTDLSGTGSTFAAHRFPVDTELGLIGFQSTAGWVSGTSANAADNVWAWSTSLNKWEQFYYNGTSWRKAGSLATQNTRVIPAGSSVIVTRIGTTTTSTLSQTIPYVP